MSFLDYGFEHVGGVEYEAPIYDVAKKNLEQLGLEDRVELLQGDAATVTDALDAYNWFYIRLAYNEALVRQVIANIKESVKRKQRHVHILLLIAMNHSFIEEDGIFRLTNQFTVDIRQRMVAVFEN